ncbi:MAG: sulfite exporter TauE/SafE family protein [Mixta calida]|uniref:sulfite exporter TauE/SafE family protein n=1 Tax=Mixta calida TaxID=665913 RepID=UPI002900E2D9|nr:sulfite exporter TauE/SafE family protein [Mixta calida]MDU3074761.1 sulfite exporter TauE/SafE family protein [Mixta calida]MDU6414606.1 sulfite exporter TauE/SafE family protein [Mixta calida]
MPEILNTSLHSLMLLLLTGGIVGFLLALTGGGGSIVCVPLLLYMVKVPDTHMVIGTSALAVAANALINVVAHAAKGNVRWWTGFTVSIIAVVGALVGAGLGKVVDGQYLIIPFAVLMLIVAGLMLRKKASSACAPRTTSYRTLPPVITWGSVLLLGVLAGFLGIGGGFLVVPLLVWFFRFSLVEAVATSLMVVFSMGLATSASYAFSGKVSPVITVWLIAGGLLGGLLGVAFASRLKKSEAVINAIFSGMLILMAIYMLLKNL